jgi:hypothetical protein
MSDESTTTATTPEGADGSGPLPTDRPYPAQPVVPGKGNAPAFDPAAAADEDRVRELRARAELRGEDPDAAEAAFREAQKLAEVAAKGEV